MRKVLHTILFITSVALASCGAKSEGKGDLAAEKAKLEDLKKQQAKIGQDIIDLETDIAKKDPSITKAEKAKLVAVTTVAPSDFTHYLDLQGKVQAENIAYVTPQNQGGQVQAIYVKQGDRVNKGQLLLKLNNEALRPQLGPLETQLENAKDLLRRRQNLWDQGIGTEVELTSAKTQVNVLQKQIDALNTQLSQYNVYAPMSGIAEQVNIKVGETFSPATAAMSGIQIVNTNDLKVSTSVPENYIGQVDKGTNVIVNFPDINKTLNATVSLVGKVIDPNSRSFYIEAKLPSDKDFKPNQLALVRIQDYNAPKAITVPVNVIQTDEKGKFVLLAVNENGKLIARKKQVEPGTMYNDTIEIKSGLQPGDVVITEGFQGLYDGQTITTK